MTLSMIVLASALFSLQARAGACVDYDDPTLFTSVSSSSVSESSGLVQSRRYPGFWWTHNDSGDQAAIYAHNPRTGAFMRSRVEGARATDWEDMGIGTCPVSRRSCLFVADIGDNAKSRASVTIYAIPEPELGRTARVELSWNFRYPGGGKNAETLLVHPTTGALYILTKESSGLSELFYVPPEASQTLTEALLVSTVDFSAWSSWDMLATGGAWSPDGESLVVRTYSGIYEWSTDPADPEAHWGEEPLVWNAPDEAQGEAITYGADGNLYTSSEGSPMPINRMRCLQRE